MTQPGKDGVAQWGGAALPDLIEAMAGRSRQLWLRLVIGVLIACIVGPSLGAPLTVGWYVAWSLLQLAEVAWILGAERRLQSGDKQRLFASEVALHQCNISASLASDIPQGAVIARPRKLALGRFENGRPGGLGVAPTKRAGKRRRISHSNLLHQAEPAVRPCQRRLVGQAAEGAVAALHAKSIDVDM